MAESMFYLLMCCCISCIWYLRPGEDIRVSFYPGDDLTKNYSICKDIHLWYTNTKYDMTQE